jgi:hypothetical protein
MDKIDRSLTLSWSMLDRKLFFILFRTEKERSPSVFATVSVRYSSVPASRGALGHGLHRLCLNPPLVGTKASVGLHPSYCALLSHQYSVTSFATLRVLSCLHSPGPRCSYCNVVRFCDLEACNLWTAAIVIQNWISKWQMFLCVPKNTRRSVECSYITARYKTCFRT